MKKEAPVPTLCPDLLSLPVGQGGQEASKSQFVNTLIDVLGSDGRIGGKEHV